MSKHTPGPWSTNSNGYFIHVPKRNGDNRTVAEAYAGADARLIAAAPEMLEALLNAQARLKKIAETSPVYLSKNTLELIESVIAKATGDF